MTRSKLLILSLIPVLFIFEPAPAQTGTDYNHNLTGNDFAITHSETTDRMQQEKSPTTAFLISTAATFTPLLITPYLNDGSIERENTLFAINAALIAFTPSTGSLYAGDTRRFLRGVLVRGIGAGLVGSGVALGGLDIFGNGSGPGMFFIIVGGGTVLISTAIDILVSSRRSVEEYNERLQQTAERINVSPWVSPDVQGGGLSVQLRF